MRIPALVSATILAASATGSAQAQTYDPDFPICMHVIAFETAYEDCRYYTMEQCRASAAGRAAQCNINPYYAGAAPPGPHNRRHRRAH